ncbi:MAG: hypothetical protein ABIV94_10560 [Acidimicrobiales bacterium]
MRSPTAHDVVAVEGPATGIFDRASAWLEARRWSIALVAVPLVPLVLLGYGTDVDVANVRAAGASLRDGGYTYSRPPGSLPHEAAIAVLDWLGGSVAADLASLAMAMLLLVAFVGVLQRAGARHATAAALVVAANPFFIIAATSLADHVWALALLVVGIWLAQSKRPVLAGIGFGLSIATRLATGVLVAAYLVTAFRGCAERRSRRPTLVTAAAAGAVALACFVPAWLSVGRSREFLRNELQFISVANSAGRWLVKNELVVGIPAWIVLLVGAPILWAGARRWRTSPLVGFAVLGAIGSELIYLRFPWKLAHLLPVLVCVVIVLALSPRVSARYLFVLAAAQLLWGFVGLRVFVPDVTGSARHAQIDVALTAGPLLNDVRCRADGFGDVADSDPERAQADSLAAWACTNSWWDGGATDDPRGASSPSKEPGR